jgi:3,4-dihydroxy 2-butanone 4-phosphate synthase/GTP cyclohydrolase II
MARMPDLEKFGAKHGLLIVTIADMIQYRLQTERLVKRVSEKKVRLDATGTEWQAMVYEVGTTRPDESSASGPKREFLALVRGDVKSADPVLCRMHAGSTLSDVFSSTEREGGKKLKEALQRIEEEGRGVVVYLPARTTLGEELAARGETKAPVKKIGDQPDPLREYGLGAQVLADLGVQKIRLLTGSPRKIAGIHGFGLEVVESVTLGGGPSDRSVASLAGDDDGKDNSRR